ncbi:cytochrome-c peroxidase [Kaarinaea lacus]
MRKRISNNLRRNFVRAAACLSCIWQAVAFSAHPPASSENLLQPDVLLVPGKIVEPISPIPSDNHQPVKIKIKLGEKLFHDARLDAKKRRTSCATCHNLEIGGTDQLAFSVNSAGKATLFNTPTIFNVSLNSQYYWSGQVNTLDEQIDDALKEVNTTWPILLRTLKGIPAYVKIFNSLYRDGITRDNVKDALIAYESSLLTPGAPFDKYLNGDAKAITQNAREGYKLFKSYGCITCHQGQNIGGNVVINLEKLNEPFGKFNSIRHRLNGKLEQIRVPSLRNVAVTPPYFHDGSATTLYQAVKRMIDEYAGIEAPDNDIYKIVSFLRALTGHYRGQSL